jgi:methionine-rich copper-binding protein CopC
LDYFGISNDDHAEETPVDEENGDDDAVDKPAAVEKRERQGTRAKIKRSLTDAERRRGQRIAKQIVDACTSKVFVETRPAAMLSSDLAIVAVLLVSGHAEGWLASKDFLDLTYRVWSFLFFDDGADEKGATRCAGALEHRHDRSESPQQFGDAIRSVRLAAALATWYFCCPKGIAHAEAVRFEVATRLAVARLPWLWHLEARDKVERELFEIARRTGWLGPDVADRWGEVVSTWNHLFEEGRALAVFEQTLLQMEMSMLRERVPDDGVAAGTLLWQGPKLGFCTLAQPAKRRSRSDQSVSVLTLRSQNRDTKLSPPYLLPFRSLLRLATDSAPEQFTLAHAEALAGFATRVESMWAATR